MELKPGDVVTLKSGGHALTVVEVNEDAVSCLWMGNEGDLFRETLPLAVLERADDEDEDEDENEDDEDSSDEDSSDDDEEDEQDEEDEPRKKTA
jgi:uncharacterized protein YodC (DUF2158 family)